MRLGGSRCLVVGGVHRLGRVIALHLADAGANVAISSRSDDADLAAAVERLRAAGAARAAGVTGDVRRVAEARALVAAADRALGGLDVLVFAASGPFGPSPPQRLSEDDWDRSLDTLAKGFFFTACAAHDRFTEAAEGDGTSTRDVPPPAVHAEVPAGASEPPEGSASLAGDAGVIVAITDCLGLQPWGSFAAHGAAKAAQIHLVKQLARAWAAERVRVCGVAPGPVDLEDDLRREATLRAARRGEWERLVRPEAVAAAVRFCIETQGVTGTNVIVDNGMLLTS